MFKNQQQRHFFIRIHRYIGLTTAIFLFITGITGSFLAYQHEIDEWLNPEFFEIKTPAATVLSPFVLQQQAQKYARNFNGFITTYALDINPNKPVKFWVSNSKEFNNLYINPSDASIIGHRRNGDLSQGIKNIVGFIYRLHYSLFLPDRVGIILLGIVALLWTFDNFISLATTLPIISGRRTQWSLRLFLRRWKASFIMRWRVKKISFHYLLHRSLGLWLWSLLCIFAWSSVAFNLPQVYKPVMHSLFSFPEPVAKIQYRPSRIISPPQALVLARQHAQHLAETQDISLGQERSLRYQRSTHSYQYRFNSSLDISQDNARSILYLNASNGSLRQVNWPTSDNAGHTITQWLYGLHMAEVFSWPYQLLVFLLGLCIAYFSYSGLFIWWNKRRKQRQRHKIAK